MSSILTPDDILRAAVLELDQVYTFDHDAKVKLWGHGEDCVRNCKPIDYMYDRGWSRVVNGALITDPAEIEFLEAKLLRDEWDSHRAALVNLSRDLFADAIIGGATYNRFNNANAAIGIGDSSTAHAVGQTDLQAASNKLRVGMDATYPQVTANAIAWRSTFSTAQGNYAWNERGVFNATPSGGQMLQRKVISLGTKTNSFSWQITCTDTITI